VVPDEQWVRRSEEVGAVGTGEEIALLVEICERHDADPDLVW
jgi:hypothetical protein